MISEGPEALNAYISSGEIEELNDLIPHTNEASENDDSNDDPDRKRSKIDRTVNHNAQIIYNNVESSMPSIPSLMAINVDASAISKIGGSGSDNDGQYGTIFGANKQSQHHPPSLLNLNVAPPFEDLSSSGGTWQSGRSEFSRNSRSEGSKRRNRDSDGNRISRFDREGGRSSRFDNNDNSRNRRSGGGSGRNQERSSGRSSRRI